MLRRYLGSMDYIWSNYSDLTRPHPKWWFSKGNPLISGKSRLVKYYNLARLYITPIKVGRIRPGYVGETTQLTITSYDHFQPDTLVEMVRCQISCDIRRVP